MAITNAEKQRRKRARAKARALAGQPMSAMVVGPATTITQEQFRQDVLPPKLTEEEALRVLAREALYPTPFSGATAVAAAKASLAEARERRKEALSAKAKPDEQAIDFGDRFRDIDVDVDEVTPIAVPETTQ